MGPSTPSTSSSRFSSKPRVSSETYFNALSRVASAAIVALSLLTVGNKVTEALILNAMQPAALIQIHEAPSEPPLPLFIPLQPESESESEGGE